MNNLLKKLALTITLLTFLLLFLPSFSGNSALAQTNSYPNDFKLLTHNVYMLSTNLYPNWGQVQRAQLIAQSDYVKGYDVVIFQEAFDNSASDKLLSGLTGEYPHQTPVLGRSRDGWDSTLSYYSATPENGGVAIVSHWPIKEKVQYVFKKGCGDDNLSNKGFVYVKVEKNEHFYHVIGTHTQAEDKKCGSGKAAEIRSLQFQEINRFIRDKNIPPDQIIFIGGDLNVNRNNSSEYSRMLADLEANKPDAYAGFTATWDPKTNGIANYNYPQDSGEYLDYILVSKNHAQPNFWHNQALDVSSPKWTVQNLFRTRTYEYTNYSDHYPVAAFAYADSHNANPQLQGN